ncbi:ER membrane protein complex subunit 3 [Plasmodium falciparum NF54]|uniref:ER membrane protein complex subunit 3 n=2 Tax=Plasmodium falciparum TaxID=5833 RepID=Q8IDA3_PLAF7|nr:ER membrane protein complex subunit 3, putative [Plasmodium falciparum 3D7]KAF4326605.1 ER membrane protein complex subunit 3 [Plasmodium falciparum NF54]PKC44623.1 ER membrane protein complex subunit 3 [Plasmodium falciparum NF54]CAD52722.1 ER membrane protein complex subunit 3, putative [Plasmodium falciparum 3D7]SOS80705.1 ER membrane protein complex subunit 3, putative [Plasmodium sp. gorilla clade G1]|eukprot:XP_001350313.1 ER membrane protein complex subunit 3, putative [Plasmodium falciparum 3D7]
MDALILDEQIRIYALLPIFVIVVLVCIIKSNLAQMIHPGPKTDMEKLSQNNYLSRFDLLKSNNGLLSPLAFISRKLFYNKPEVGYFNDLPEQANPFDALLKQDPSDLFGMMKNQIPFLVLQLGLGFLINLFFSGYLVAKIPFPLTYKFKSTLQMGMDIELLDMKFVSSLSWYFLVMFGSSGLISIIDYFVLQDKDRSQNNAMDNLMATHNPLAKPPGNMNNIPDLRKFFNKKKEELDNVKYEFLLENIECELLQKWE